MKKNIVKIQNTGKQAKLPIVKTHCAHLWHHQESTIGGGVVCMKCKQII